MLRALERPHSLRSKSRRYRRHSRPSATSTPLVDLDRPRANSLLVLQLARTVNLYVRAVVWIAGLLGCVLVHLQAQARTVHRFLRSDCSDFTWGILVD